MVFSDIPQNQTERSASTASKSCLNNSASVQPINPIPINALDHQGIGHFNTTVHYDNPAIKKLLQYKFFEPDKQLGFVLFANTEDPGPNKTLEALGHNPRRFLDQLDIQNIPDHISNESLIALIACLAETNMNSSVNFLMLMKLVDKHPSLLSVKDFRSLITELAIKNMNTLPPGDLITLTEGFSESQSSQSLATAIIQKRLSLLLHDRNKHMPECLMLINMLRKLNNNIAMDPDIKKMVHTWALDALDVNSPLYDQRREIWQAYVLLFDNHTSITAEDAKNILLAKNVIRSAPKVESEINYTLDLEMSNLFEKLNGPCLMLLTASDELLQASLDDICKRGGYSLPVNSSWTGTYPDYACGDYRINVEEGLLRAKDGTIFGTISKSDLTNPEFKEIFKGQNLSNVKTKKQQLPNGVTCYIFIDNYGIKCCIRKEGSKTTYHREIKLPNRPEISVQALSRESFFGKYSTPVSSLKPSTKLKIMIKKVLGFKPSLSSFLKEKDPPAILKNPDHQLWVSAVNPQVIFVTDKKGTPLYEVHLDRSRKKQNYVLKLHSADPNQQFRLAYLSPKAHPALKELTRFESQSQISVWITKDGIASVELPRFGMEFVVKDNHVICNQPPYEGWIVNTGREEMPWH